MLSKLTVHPTQRRTILGVLIGIGIGLLALLASTLPIVRMAENRSLDLRFRLFPEPELRGPDIVLIVVDDPSLQRMERETEVGGRWPFTRDVHAALIDYLSAGGARAIVFDVLFTEEDRLHPELDRMLAESTRAAGNVYYAALVHPEKGGKPPLSRSALDLLKPKTVPVTSPASRFPSTPTIQDLTLPLPLIMGPARGVGAVNHWPDADGAARRTPLLYRYGGFWIPSLPLAVARDVMPGGGDRPIEMTGSGLRIAGKELRPDAEGRLPIHWYGGVGTYPYYPVRDVLLSYSQLSRGDAPIVPPETFRGKIVLIGVTAAGVGELKVTPFSPLYPGVEIMATVIDNIRQGRFLREAPRFLSAAVTIGLPLLCGLIVLAFPRLRVNLPVLVSMILIYAGLVAAAFRMDAILPVVTPFGAVFWVYTIGVAANYLFEGRQKKRLSRYFSPQVIREILNDPRRVRMGGERKDLTVLFSDIRGFTSLSEKMETQEVTAQLSEYFTEMVEAIFRRRGCLDKYVGDAVMAFWGVPEDPDHATHAVLTAFEMLERLERLNAKWRAEGRVEFEIGIGIHSGVVVIGNVGSPQQMNYTVIGDNVNLASRLEGVNKEYGTRVLISEATCEKVKDVVEIRYIDEIKVKGRAASVKIYEAVRVKKTAT